MAAEDQNQHNRHEEEDLDEYGVWVKSGPEDIGEDDDPDAQSIADLELSEMDDLSTDLSEEEESLLAELQDTDEQPETPSGSEVESEGGIDFTMELSDEPEHDEPDGSALTSMDDEEDIPDLEIDDTDAFDDVDAGERRSSERVTPASNHPVTEIELEEEAQDDQFGFDDVSAVSEELSRPAHDAGKRSTREYSTEAFDQIQAELSSIKSELSSLKEQIHSISGSAGAAGGPAQSESADALSTIDVSPDELASDDLASAGDQAPADGDIDEGDEQLTEGGFFEEDEDETIALTGDELDNILNTAEFTEEEGKPTDIDDSDLDLDLSSLGSEGYEELEIDEDSGDDSDILSEDPGSVEDNELPPEADDFVFDDAEHSAEATEDDMMPTMSDDSTFEAVEPIGTEELSTDATGTDDPFAGSEEEVDALANMDIDSELSDIEELDDDLADSPAAESGDTNLQPSSSESFNDENSETPEVADDEELPEGLKDEIKSVLSYMDQLLESLPEERIKEFANSEHFEVYKRLFEELGLEP